MTVDCVCSIPRECGRSYTGETGILWPQGLGGGRDRENMEVGHLESSRLGQHSFEENHCVLWDEAKVFRD